MMNDFGDELTLLTHRDVRRIAEETVRLIKEDKELAKDLLWLRRSREISEAYSGSRRKVIEVIVGTAGATGLVAILALVGSYVIMLLNSLLDKVIT